MRSVASACCWLFQATARAAFLPSLQGFVPWLLPMAAESLGSRVVEPPFLIASLHRVSMNVSISLQSKEKSMSLGLYRLAGCGKLRGKSRDALLLHVGEIRLRRREPIRCLEPQTLTWKPWVPQGQKRRRTLRRTRTLAPGAAGGGSPPPPAWLCGHAHPSIITLNPQNPEKPETPKL